MIPCREPSPSGNRPHQVDSAPGFIRMEVANPGGDPKEFWLLTWWRDAASFDADAGARSARSA